LLVTRRVVKPEKVGEDLEKKGGSSLHIRDLNFPARRESTSTSVEHMQRRNVKLRERGRVERGGKRIAGVQSFGEKKFITLEDPEGGEAGKKRENTSEENMGAHKPGQPK